MEGYIKTHRKVLCHWLYQEKPFDRYHAWEDILLNVNHKRNTFPLGNKLVTAERGQVVTSLRKLGERWGWSQEKVRRFLNLLQSDAMIEIYCDTTKTVITIVNWDFYQSEDKQTRQVCDTSVTGIVTNKNEKNEKNKSLSPANYRSRYSDKELKIIDEFFEVLRHTRKSAKIADSVILNIYKGWEAHEAQKVVYSLHRYIHTPSLHDKNENYVLGIIRNATAPEIEKYRLSLTTSAEQKQRPPRKSRIEYNENGTPYTVFEENEDV